MEMDIAEIIKREVLAYPRRNYYLMWYHRESILDLQSLVVDGWVLDLGCGEGHLTSLIPKQYKICAVDISVGNLIKIKKVNQAINIENVEVIVADALNLPFRENSFDAVISTQVIEHLPDDKRMISEVTRILCFGGYFMLATTIKGPINIGLRKNIFGQRVLSPDHLREYSSMESLVEICKQAGAGRLELVKTKKKYVRFSLRRVLGLLFPLIRCQRLLVKHPLLIPVPAYYYDGYLVLRKSH